MTEQARTRRLAVVALAVLAVLVSSCVPANGSVSGPVRRATLTSTSGTFYRYVGDRNGLFAIPPVSFSDTNVREVYWYPDSPNVTDQMTCMTWNTVAFSQSNGLFQPGVALRIAPSASGFRGVKAITVTQNIMFGAVWLFNVHIWNSLDVNQPFTLVGQFDLTPVVGTLLGSGPSLAPAPWHICARVRGNQFKFMVWTGSNPQPSWSDPSRVYTTKLPAGWVYPGVGGGYVGHFHVGQAAGFSAVTSTALS